ncbi:hypothetical protein GN244_ATG13054 [Phytophthora infestans]|uniref:Uncharacterized protein n=1 Tax=Phytophthora infestans TaxID=4787 RepID=A0A833WHH1_PHYIN|nr:hypothetical protein GN244_ATG13054 [Phytophthora infestans]
MTCYDLTSRANACSVVARMALVLHNINERPSHCRLAEVDTAAKHFNYMQLYECVQALILGETQKQRTCRVYSLCRSIAITLSFRSSHNSDCTTCHYVYALPQVTETYSGYYLHLFSPTTNRVTPYCCAYLKSAMMALPGNAPPVC